jgi:DNA-binding transcriptional ArsR family regulator
VIEKSQAQIRPGFPLGWDALTAAIYFYICRNMKIKTAVVALAALSQETRLAVFRRLVAAGPEGKTAGALALALKVPAPTLSFHVKELERAGLVTHRRLGRNMIYTANYAAMRALLSFLMEDCCGGRPEICKIDLKACCAA